MAAEEAANENKAKSIKKIHCELFHSKVKLGSHCRFSSIDSESHRQNEECRQV